MIMSIHEGNRQGCIRYNTVSALALALALTVALPYTPAGDAVQNKTEQTLNSLYGRYPLFYNTHQEKHEENVSFSLSLHLIVLFFFFYLFRRYCFGHLFFWHSFTFLSLALYLVCQKESFGVIATAGYGRKV
jgi:glucan phosphoethanolaminetransferase (alkaline phosphatase superfamily)